MTTPTPRLTRNDLRLNSGMYLRSDDPRWTKENEALAANTRCEHGCRLTDSCSGCAAVEAKLEQATEDQQQAYWAIVAYEAAHLAPTTIRRASADALDRLDLVQVYTRPSTGEWTAVPPGQREHTHDYTHLQVGQDT